MKQSFNPARIGIYLLLVLFAFVFLIPVYVLLASSLKPFVEVQDLSRLWSPPKNWTLESFRAAWSGIPDKGLRGLSRNLVNSILLTVPATIISSLLGSINGYLLSKWKFPGADVIFPLMLFGMFIPYQSVLIPLT
jgi:glucose/mannose transport system permease protein